MTAGTVCRTYVPYETATSSASKWVVAGSTTSAKRAVSVITWSWTTVNRSSRASPRSIVRWSGAVAAGLAPCTNSTDAGAAPGSSPQRMAPTRFMLTVPACAGRSPSATRRLDSGEAPDRLAMTPAPR